jgi:hypothetical protein
MKNRNSAVTAVVWGAFALGAANAQAAQVPYGIFTGAGAVSNMTLLTPEGDGCTANCDGSNPVYGGHGYTYDGTNNVTFTWDGSVYTSSADYTGPGGASNASISSPRPLFSMAWTAHDVQIFGPGTYSFNTAAGGGVPESGAMTMTVGAGQLGMHILFDWNGNNNIDIVNVWNLHSTFSNCGSPTQDSTAMNCLWTGTTNTAGNNAGTVFLLASTDNDGDGTLGIPQVAGSPFGPCCGYGGFNFNFNMQGTLAPIPVPAALWLFGTGLAGLFGIARRGARIS